MGAHLVPGTAFAPGLCLNQTGLDGILQVASHVPKELQVQCFRLLLGYPFQALGDLPQQQESRVTAAYLKEQKRAAAEQERQLEPQGLVVPARVLGPILEEPQQLGVRLLGASELGCPWIPFCA